MKLKIHTPLVFTTLMLVLIAAMMVIGSNYPKDVSIVPFVVGIPTFIVLLVLWLGYIFPEWKLLNSIILLEETDGIKGDNSDFTGWSQELNTLGWLLVYYIFIFIFGFIVATPVFLAAFFIQKTDLNATKSILIAIISSFVIIRFVQSLGIDLWLGAVPKTLPNYWRLHYSAPLDERAEDCLFL